MTRELAVDDSFEKVIETFVPGTTENGATEVRLSVEQLHRCRGTDLDLSNFIQAVRLVVQADESDGRVAIEDAERELQLDQPALTKLGLLLRAERDVWR